MQRTAFTFAAALLTLLVDTSALANPAETSWASDRLTHAKELLGKYYGRSVAALEQDDADTVEFQEFVGERIRAKLPARDSGSHLRRIEETRIRPDFFGCRDREREQF